MGSRREGDSRFGGRFGRFKIEPLQPEPAVTIPQGGHAWGSQGITVRGGQGVTPACGTVMRTPRGCTWHYETGTSTPRSKLEACLLPIAAPDRCSLSPVPGDRSGAGCQEAAAEGSRDEPLLRHADDAAGGEPVEREAEDDAECHYWRTTLEPCMVIPLVSCLQRLNP